MSLKSLEIYINQLKNIIQGLTMMGEDEKASGLIYGLNRYIDSFVGKNKTFEKMPVPTSSAQKTKIPVKRVVFGVDNDNDVVAASRGKSSTQAAKIQTAPKLPSTSTINDKNCQVDNLEVTEQTMESDEEDNTLYSYSSNESVADDTANSRTANSTFQVPINFDDQQTGNQNNRTRIMKRRNSRPYSGGRTAPREVDIITPQDTTQETQESKTSGSRIGHRNSKHQEA